MPRGNSGTPDEANYLEQSYSELVGIALGPGGGGGALVGSKGPGVGGFHGCYEFRIRLVANVHQPVIRVLAVEAPFLRLIGPLEPMVADGFGQARQARDVVGVRFGARGLI